MALMYKPNPDALHTPLIPGEPCTEPEHKDSCDINKMLKIAARGGEIRLSHPGEYGYDDTTLSGLDHRIQKQTLEQELAQAAETGEFTDEEIQAMPTRVREKFGFKAKKKEPPSPTANDDLNDEQVGNEVPPQRPPPKKKRPDPPPGDDQASSS